ncbi:hypothetical protein ONS95_001816 [Cadophora gregata]|uniref:uncharacterized protein n=1 Tax=Cadophora gregata TaxID=51156 RepID=UPI0026DC982E|nr:uncharacterized protein ONS95_001816 [Cadophora gregata]KAK0111460.1 hypothetical protein ONS95_001816 [Cadophora gregata]
MSSSIHTALLEGTYLLQAFIAGLEVSQLYFFNTERYTHHLFNYLTVAIAPILALALLLTVLTQLRLSSPTRQQTLRIEFIKSGLVTILWVWLVVWSWDFWGNRSGHGTVHKIVSTVVSLVFAGGIYYSTLFVALRRERGGRISLRDEAGSLLPH